jgi:glycosyltransferase involved in cell wall biosynthesis
MHDVIVSVWNRFHSFALIDGLTSGGFDVLGLGTTRRRPNCAEFYRCWSAALLTQASYHLPTFRKRLTEEALNRFEKFARKHVLEARCFWGWNTHHLSALQKATAHGVPVILETGSTHAVWQQKVVVAEYDRHGIDFSSHYDPSQPEYCVKEYDLADHICVPSQFVASTFRQHGVPSEKLAVNPYGVDVSFWRQAFDLQEKTAERCIFIYVGQIMLRKGIAYLLEASQRLDQNAHEIWLVGGVDQDSLSLVQSLPNNIKLLQRKNHLEIRDLYRRAHVFVLPSLEEGMARALLEAMAAGLPVIATQETGITDIMLDQEDGWLVPSCDAAALASVMQEAISNPKTVEARGRSAAKRAEPYTWEAYGERAAKFLFHLIRSKQ